MAADLRAPRAGRRASTSSTRSRCCRCSRSSAAERTDDATLATAFAVGKTLKKSCVLVKDAPGVRRQPAAHPVPGRGHRGGRRGHAVRGRRPGAGRRSACRCRRSCCSQLVGPAVALHVAETMHEAFPDRFACRSNLRPAGRGRQAGPAQLDGRTAEVDPEVAALFEAATAPLDRARRSATGALAALAEEIRLMLDEGVVAEPRTSTCACCSAPAGRSTSAASRRTSTAPASPSGSPAAASSRRGSPACP